MSRAPAKSVFRRWMSRLLTIGVLLGAYPLFVLVAVYAYWFDCGLPGGRNGPADAYRHSLASAIVAYTSSPRCVDLVTRVMERDGEGTPSRAMDAHNNRIGAQIGASANSWKTMQRAVRAAVEHGTVGATSADQITWLAPDAWQERIY